MWTIYKEKEHRRYIVIVIAAAISNFLGEEEWPESNESDLDETTLVVPVLQVIQRVVPSV